MAGVARLELAFTPWDVREFLVSELFLGKKMAGVARLELATHGFGDRCSTN